MALCGLYYITAITFISNNFSIFLNIQNNLLFCQTDKKTCLDMRISVYYVLHAKPTRRIHFVNNLIDATDCLTNMAYFASY